MVYENGAQLSIPDRLTVETKAMGRGMKAEIMSRYTWRYGTDDGSRIMREPHGWEPWARDKDSFDTYELFKAAERGACSGPW